MNDLGGNTMSHNATNGVDLQGGTYTQSGVLNLMTSIPYVVRSGGVTFSKGVTLVPGVVVKLWGGSFFQTQQVLNAVGTSRAPIVFTSFRDDTVGGHTNQFEGVISPLPNDWRTVFLSGLTASGSQLSYVQFRYGGQNEGANLYVDQSTGVAISQSQFSRSSADGIVFNNGASGLIQGTTFQNNTRNGIRGYDSNSGPLTLLNNAFLNNQVWGAALPGNSASLISGNIFDGNASHLMLQNGSGVVNFGSNTFRNATRYTTLVYPNIYLNDLGGNTMSNNATNGVDLQGGTDTQSQV